MRSLFLALSLVASVAQAQQQVEDRSVWERCYGGTTPAVAVDVQPWAGPYYYGPVVQPVPVPSGGGAGSSPLSGFGSMGGSGAPAFLVLAVVAVAALPVIVYAVDSPAPPQVMHRFRCPSFSFESWGGAEGGGGRLAAVVTGRMRFGFSYIGADLQFDASPDGVTAFSAALLLRPTPREHIEGGLSTGFKRAYLNGAVREGLELALPHQYVVWRNEGRQLGIELRPAVLISTRGVDASVDLALNIPIVDILSARVGGRVFSYGPELVFGANAGLSLHL